jgi:hypothetical protein
MVVTVAVVATLAATLVAAGPGSRAPAFAATDPSLPSVTITSPASGSYVLYFTSITIEAEASPGADGQPVKEVRFSAFGRELSTDSTAPYELVRQTSWNGPAEFTAVAVAEDGKESPPATVELVSYPPPGVFLTPPGSSVIPVDATNQTLGWQAKIAVQDNLGRPPDDPRIWLDHADISVDGVVVQTVTGVEGCGTTCPAPGRPTTMTQTFSWNPAETGRGAHTISVHVMDNVGYETTTKWPYTGVNRPALTLRGLDGAAVPETMRLPAGSVLSFDAEVANDEPTRTTIRSVDLLIDGGRRTWPVACSAPSYCPASVVVREDWTSAGAGVHELRIVATDQWGIQAVATVHVDVYPGTRLTIDIPCCDVFLGGSKTVSGQLTDWDSFAALPGARVTIAWRPIVGATSWQTLATRTTSSTGRFSVRHSPRRNGTYRLTYAGVAGTLGGAVVTRGVIVHPRVKGHFRRHESVRRDHVARLKVHTSRADPGAMWYLQRYRYRTDDWITIAKRRIPSSRHATFKVRPHRHGYNSYAILRPATAGYGDAFQDFAVFAD